MRASRAGSGPGLRVLRLRATDCEKRAETRRSQTNHQFFHSVILRVAEPSARQNARQSRTLHHETESPGSAARWFKPCVGSAPK